MNQIKNWPLCQGQKRIDKYIVSMKNLLGRGSFASVYKGMCITDNAPTAIKVIDQKIFASTYNSKAIVSQIQIMKNIRHKNIVELKDVYQSANNMYIVTQFCQNGDLKGYLKKRGKIIEPEALRLLRDIMNGFKYLCEHGIIHRDLKPANILLHKNRCKIADFGFAKNLDEGHNTILQSIVGTPLYMSPQILNLQKYTNKSDLWSVGLIYYELLHGYTPWPAKNEIQLLNNIMTKPVKFDSGISQKSRDFIKMCLKVKEQDRMSWQQAFNHTLLIQDQTDTILRKLRFDENRFTSKDNSSPYRFSRSKSQKKAINNTRTPKMKKQLSGFEYTPDRVSMWRG